MTDEQIRNHPDEELCRRHAAAVERVARVKWGVSDLERKTAIEELALLDAEMERRGLDPLD